MYVPGVGKLRWGVVYFCVAVLVTTMFFLVVYPRLPVAPAKFTPSTDSSELTLVEVDKIGTDPQKTPLVCPIKNSRCSTINDDRVNYDQSIVNDFENFIEIIKTKIVGAPSWGFGKKNNNNNILILDIGAYLGYFSFSLGTSLSTSSSSSSSPSSSDSTKFLAIDASSQNIAAIQKTQEIAKKNSLTGGDSNTNNNNNWFQNVHTVQAALSSPSAQSAGHQCFLLSEEKSVNDFSLMCPSFTASGENQNNKKEKNNAEGGSHVDEIVEAAGNVNKIEGKISFVDKTTSEKKNYAVRGVAPALSTLDDLFLNNKNNNKNNEDRANKKDEYFQLSNKDIIMAKIDVGSAANALDVLEGAEKSFFSSSSSSLSSSPHVIVVRLSAIDPSQLVVAASAKRADLMLNEVKDLEFSPEIKKALRNNPLFALRPGKTRNPHQPISAEDPNPTLMMIDEEYEESGKKKRSSQQLFSFMSKRGYVVYLPSNKTIVPMRDFSGNVFDPYSNVAPVSSQQEATVYFIRGDISHFLLCTETNVALLLGFIVLVVFGGMAYMYFLNSRMHSMMKGGGGGGGVGGLLPGVGGGHNNSFHHQQDHQMMPNFNMSPAFGMLNSNNYYSSGAAGMGAMTMMSSAHQTSNSIMINKNN